MFWRKKPTADYALRDFQRMMHLLRRWTNERSSNPSEDEIYSLTLLVLTYFAYCLKQTAMSNDEILSFTYSCSREMTVTFKKTEEKLAEDGVRAMQWFQAHDMYFADAAREAHAVLERANQSSLTQQDFVTVCSSACAGIIGKLQKDGFISG